MEVSFVSKARTAFNSAAAKAEKVLADIKKSDSTTDPEDDSDIPSPKASVPESINSKDEKSKNCGEEKQSRRKPPPIKIKQDWHERFKTIRIGKKGSEDTEKAENSKMAYAIFDENLYMIREREFFHSEDSKYSSGAQDVDNSNANIIPSTSVVRQLAIAIDAGKNYTSMTDLMASSRDSSPVRERAALGFSAMKSLVLREKDEKLVTEFGTNEKVLSLIKSLLDAEDSPLRNDDCGQGEIANTSALIKDIHGAPPESFVVKLSEAIGNLKTLRKMASFWCRVVTEVRRLSSEWKYIPGIPPDEIPDLNCCLLYQQLQVINSCISRKRRRYEATESLDAVITQASLTVDVPSVSEGTVPVNSLLYAKTSTGELVLRLGADKKWDNVVMLETGQPVYTPVLQEAPLLTEDVIKETEEFVLRTGSVGAGCSQLLSDMQAFKAANPGCILEDFVRWHSPPDWSESGTASDAEESSDSGDSSSLKGQLSRRMRKEGNLWRELWETAKPVPAMKQTPLFDEDLAAEGILHFLSDISPSELFQQLFISLLGSGFVAAEPILSSNSVVAQLFYECKDFIIATCQRRTWTDKIDEICQVYETIETMLLNPDEVMNTTVPEETTSAGELKNRFKKLGSIFSGKDRQLGKLAQKELKNVDENTTKQSFSSIFSKKPPKTGNASAAADNKAANSVENDWTIV